MLTIYVMILLRVDFDSQLLEIFILIRFFYVDDFLQIIFKEFEKTDTIALTLSTIYFGCTIAFYESNNNS